MIPPPSTNADATATPPGPAHPGSAPGITRISLQPGDKVDSFTVIETIATTGSANVYKAHDALLDRFVAIKQVVLSNDDADDRVRKRVRDEAATHKRVSAGHPKHLVQFIHTVDDPRGMMLISEYYPSTSLEALLTSTSEPLGERQALGILAATAKGLEAIHGAGVIHRDLKPSNILLGHDNGLKVCDFGLAAVIEAQDSLSLGSVRYMAPELLRGEPADERADLYALGMIGYEMLAGREQFDNAFRTVLRDQRNQAMRWMKWHTNPRVAATPLSELNPALPEHLVALVTRMMEKDPVRRVGQASDVVDAIRRHFTGEAPDPTLAPVGPSGETTAHSTPGDTAPLPQRSKLPLILGGLLLFWVLVGGTLLLVNHYQKTAAASERQAAATADLNDAKELYEGGNYLPASERYEGVLSDWPGGTEYHAVAQAGLWKTQGRIAFDAGRFGEAVDYLERYRGSKAGDPSSVTDLISDARRAEAFQLSVQDILTAIDEGGFSRGRQVIAELSEMTITPKEQATLDDLSRQLAEQELRRATESRILEARRLESGGKRGEAILLLEGVATLPDEGRQLLESWRSDAAYDDAIGRAEAAEASGDLLAAVTAYEEAVAIKPSEELRGTINVLESRRLTAEGKAALDAGNVEVAGVRLNAALERNPDNAEALRYLALIASVTERTKLVQAGDAAVAAGDYVKAIEQYEAAVAVEPSEPINAKLRDARLKRDLKQADDAIASGDLTAAAEALALARTREPDNADVQKKLDELDTRVQYTKLLADAAEARTRSDFGKAKRILAEAQKLLDTEEVKELVIDTEYEQNLDQGKRYLEAGQKDAALGRFRIARTFRDTPEVRALIVQLEGGTAATGSGGGDTTPSGGNSETP